MQKYTSNLIKYSIWKIIGDYSILNFIATFKVKAWDKFFDTTGLRIGFPTLVNATAATRDLRLIGMHMAIPTEASFHASFAFLPTQ